MPAFPGVMNSLQRNLLNQIHGYYEASLSSVERPEGRRPLGFCSMAGASQRAHFLLLETAQSEATATRDQPLR